MTFDSDPLPECNQRLGLDTKRTFDRTRSLRWRQQANFKTKSLLPYLCERNLAGTDIMIRHVLSSNVYCQHFPAIGLKLASDARVVPENHMRAELRAELRLCLRLRTHMYT